jgi:hypothetical protein
MQTRSNEWILANAVIVDADDESQPDDCRAMAAFHQGLATYTGRFVRVVRWPDGVTASLDCDPTNKEMWNDLVLRTYRQAAIGIMGYVERREPGKWTQ